MFFFVGHPLLKVKKNLLIILLVRNPFDVMNQKEVKLRIYGMTCDDCVASVTRSLKEQRGVLEVNVSLKDGAGMIKVNPEEVSPEELLRNRVFVKPSHYKATLIED